MEENKILLDEDEEILWDGEPHEKAMTRYFEFISSYFPGILAIIGSFLLLLGLISFLILLYGIPLDIISIVLIGTFFIMIIIFGFLITIYKHFSKIKTKNINYFITNKRIFIISNKLEISFHGFNYIFDSHCTFLGKFDKQDNIAWFSINLVSAVQLRQQQNRECYDIYLIYSNRFKLIGIRDPSRLINVIKNRLNFQRKFHNVKLETYVRKKE